MIEAQQVESMGEGRNAYIFVRTCEENSPLGRPKCRCKGIRTYLAEVELKGMKCIHVAQGSVRCWILVNSVMDLGVPLNVKNLSD
jgi:hypothetical protein